MPQFKVGTVISNKMEKTVVVKVVSKVRHPLYKKQVTYTRKFKAHTEIPVKIGQTVKILEIKPISKDKYFKVLKVI